jgi:hypothetical protein
MMKVEKKLGTIDVSKSESLNRQFMNYLNPVLSVPCVVNCCIFDFHSFTFEF